MRATTILAAAALACGSLLLTACAPATTGTPAPAGTAAAPTTAASPASPAPVAPTPPQQPVPAVGSTITTADDAAAVRDAGLAVYVTATGAQLVIDPAGPLPQAVYDEARATGLGPTALPDSASVHAAGDQLKDVYDRTLAATGKKVIFIYLSGVYGDWDDDDLKSTYYGAVLYAPELRTGPIGKPATAAEVRATVQARIDTQPNPAQYEFLDLTT